MKAESAMGGMAKLADTTAGAAQSGGRHGGWGGGEVRRDEGARSVSPGVETSDFAVAARQPAVVRPQAALRVLGFAFALPGAGFVEGLVGAREERDQETAPESRPRAGRGSVAVLFGFHRFDPSFGGVR